MTIVNFTKEKSKASPLEAWYRNTSLYFFLIRIFILIDIKSLRGNTGVGEISPASQRILTERIKLKESLTNNMWL